jgi:hypothetical protein
VGQEVVAHVPQKQIGMPFRCTREGHHDPCIARFFVIERVVGVTQRAVDPRPYRVQVGDVLCFDARTPHIESFFASVPVVHATDPVLCALPAPLADLVLVDDLEYHHDQLVGQPPLPSLQCLCEIRRGPGVDQLWIRCGSDVDQIWISSGSAVDQAWISCGSGVDQVWIRRGSGVDQVWIRCGSVTACAIYGVNGWQVARIFDIEGVGQDGGMKVGSGVP